MAGVSVGFLISACGSQSTQTPAVSLAQSAAPSSRELLNSALRDAAARDSVREIQRSGGSAASNAMVDDIAVHVGRQRIVLRDGVTAQVLVIGNTAYISGDETALRRYFGFPANVAQTVGDRWIRIPSTAHWYATVADDATLPSALHDIELRGHLTEQAPSTLDGQSVVGILGTAAHISGGVRGTVYVSRSKVPLPVGATFQLGNGATLNMTFERWGEPLNLSAPARVISLSALTEASRAVPQTSGPTRSSSSSEAGSSAATDSTMTGYWFATGTVTSAHDSAVQETGEVIRRLWLIRRMCSGQICQLELTRQTAGSTADTTGTPLTSVLTRSRAGWFAWFSEPDVYCDATAGPAGSYVPGLETSSWQLTRSSSGAITATEQTQTSGPGCVTATSTIDWTAVRMPAAQAAATVQS